MEVNTNLDYLKLSGAVIYFKDLTRRSVCKLDSIPARYKKNFDFSDNKLSRPLIMGRFFHDLLENISDAAKLGLQDGGQMLHERHESLLNEYSFKYAEFTSDYGIPITEWNTYSIYEKAQDLLRREIIIDGVIEREIEIGHSNGLLRGILDELIVDSDSLSITEYKLKKSKKEIQTERNIRQLHFYACLAKDKYPNREVTLELIGLGDVFHEVQLNDQLCASIHEEAAEFAEFLREIGRRNTDPGDLCVGCEYCRVDLPLPIEDK